MAKEDKELLLKDLCGRLPYGVKVNVIYSNENASSFRQRVCVEGDNELNTDIVGLYQRNEIDIKPYLFPLSSMTDEQKKELSDEMCYFTHSQIEGRDPNGIMNGTIFEIDFYNKNHIDYRGLIEKGLANDATGLNIY